MTSLHDEYLTLIRLINLQIEDRALFVKELQSLFTGRQYVNPVVFKNLIKAIGAFYDSFIPEPTVDPQGFSYDFTWLKSVRDLSQLYFMQAPQSRQNDSATNNSSQIMMSPCLENQLKAHRIWTFPEAWIAISIQLDVKTILGIHFLQDQMAAYEVDPDLLQQVSLHLVNQIRSKQEENNVEGKEEKVELGTTTAMSGEAEEGCHSRIETYRQIYNQRMEEKKKQIAEEAARERQMQNERRQSQKGGIGFGSQLQSLVGGLLAGSGIRIEKNNKRRDNKSPKVIESAVNNRKNVSMINTDSAGQTRPSLASLL